MLPPIRMCGGGLGVIELHHETRIVAMLLLVAVAGCSGGGSSIPKIAVQPGSDQSTNPQSSISREAQSDALHTWQPHPAAGSADLLYVGNTGNNSITVYRHDASGNTPPLYVIAGSSTGISNPGQLSQDAQGNLYVANSRVSVNPGILVFAHGAKGNVAPIRTLGGPLTGLHKVEAMTVDKTTGKIFVVDSEPDRYGYEFFASVLRFPPNAARNTPPFARSADDLYNATQIASDSSGNNIIEAHYPASPNADFFGIATYPKQFPNLAPFNPIYRVDDLASLGVADDPTTKTYLETSFSGDGIGGGIYRLAENSVGNGPYGGDGIHPIHMTPAIVSVITSDTCGAQLAVAPGPSPNTYVTHNAKLRGCSTDAVYVYRHDASGFAAPLRVLSGSATGLNAPYGIYEGC